MSPIVLTVALNGYYTRYRRLIKSQQAYADCNEYQMLVANRPIRPVPRRDTAWLKIGLVLRALDVGYPWVLVLDSDARVAEHTPPIESLDEPGKDLHVVRGRSGMVNSGVMAVKNTERSRKLFGTIMADADVPVTETVTGKWRFFGENPHVIQATEGYLGLRVLDERWNNTVDPTMNDYIRHHTGPMRDERHSGLRYRFVDRLQRRLYRHTRTMPAPGTVQERVAELVELNWSRRAH